MIPSKMQQHYYLFCEHTHTIGIYDLIDENGHFGHILPLQTGQTKANFLDILNDSSHPWLSLSFLSRSH